jgi:hypothetical protein
MPLSNIARVGFGADVVRTRGDLKRPPAPQKRKPADSTPDVEAEPNAFLIVNEGAPSTAGLSILAQALAAYSEY